LLAIVRNTWLFVSETKREPQKRDEFDDEIHSPEVETAL